MWDREIEPGQPFTDAIKTRIACAHLFLPLLTETHRVTGLLVDPRTLHRAGMDVPVLPVAIGRMPDQMIQQLQAIEVGPRLEGLADQLNAARIERCVLQAAALSRTVYECADHPERRTELIGRYTAKVKELGGHGPMRQSGALSSFSLPDQPPDHPIWRERDGPVRRSQYLYERYWEERRALEEHARVHGCRLMLDPTITLPQNGPRALKARLQTLVDFLRAMDDAKVQVVIRERMEPGNLLIVDDWFYAESVTPRPGMGYRQTMFTWHAPSVLRRLQGFERTFDHLLHEQGVAAEKSRSVTIERIEEIIRGIRE